MSTTTTAVTAVPTGTWSVDAAHSRVGFQVKHLGIATVRGQFNEFQGQLTVAEDGSLSASGSVKTASVDTNEPQRDDHLRSADFFGVDEHPELIFRSTRIAPTGEDELEIVGELSLHGVTKEIVLRAEVQGTETDPWGNERVGLEVSGQLSRGEYGMTFNQALGSGNVLVSDKVKLSLDVSAVKQAAA